MTLICNRCAYKNSDAEKLLPKKDDFSDISRYRQWLRSTKLRALFFS